MVLFDPHLENTHSDESEKNNRNFGGFHGLAHYLRLPFSYFKMICVTIKI